MECPKCGSTQIGNKGKSNGVNYLRCKNCGRSFKGTLDEAELNLPVPEPSRNCNVRAMSETELRSKYDNLFICQQGIEKLTKGLYYAEREFIQLCGFKSTNYRSAIEDSKFMDYHGTAGGITYWGTKDDIKRLKNEGILR